MIVVVIPAFLRSPHEADQLVRCVSSILAQPVVGRVVVADDASLVPLPPLPAGAELVRLEVNRGPAAARNRGAARARELGAHTILFTDVDCVPDPGWAAAHERFLARTQHVAAGGVTRPLGVTMLDRYHDFSGSLNGFRIVPMRDALLYAPTCNVAVRAEAMERVRFDERFPVASAEDVDFGMQLRGLGTIGFAPEAIVRHDFGYASTLRGLGRFAAMFRRYGQGDPLLFEKHPELSVHRTEACAPPDGFAAVLPADPAAYGRPALRRIRPRRFLPAMLVLRHLARQAFRSGQRAPRPWRDVAAAPTFPSA